MTNRSNYSNEFRENCFHCEFLDYWNIRKSVNIFHVYLMREFQKCGRNWILRVAFWGQTKAGQKWAARWAELAVLFCRELKKPSWEFIFFYIFLESPHLVDMKNVVKSSKHFFGYFNTLETHSVLTVHAMGNWEKINKPYVLQR